MELKKIGILSLAKITCIFGIIYGLVSGILISILYTKAAKLASLGIQIPTTVTALGFKSLIVYPILDGVIYFIAGVILAWLYNLIASWIGGIQLEFKEKPSEKKK